MEKEHYYIKIIKNDNNNNNAQHHDITNDVGPDSCVGLDMPDIAPSCFPDECTQAAFSFASVLLIIPRIAAHSGRSDTRQGATQHGKGRVPLLQVIRDADQPSCEPAAQKRVLHQKRLADPPP